MIPVFLYVGDVPVEASYHGSALLHRMLSDYPPEKLTILETATQSKPERRIPHVNGISQPIGKQRWLDPRFHPYAMAWFTNASKRAAQRISQSINGFDYQSVFTVAHGFGWLAGGEIAETRRVPLHLAVHDDWPRIADVPSRFRNWLDGSFARVYRQARSRCVCLLRWDVLTRSARCSCDGDLSGQSDGCDSLEEPARLRPNDDQFTIAFAGTIDCEGYIDALKALQKPLKPVSGRLLIFSPRLMRRHGKSV